MSITTKNFDLEQVQSIYFIGIGGIGMSAAAGLASKQGFKVAGSDAKTVYSPAKDVLDEFEIDYHIGYDEEHIKDNPADLYIFSAGETLENPEVKYVIDQGLTYASFPELLYELSKDKLRIVVAGTHGKSTTAGLLGTLLKELDDSSFMVGAVLQGSETNFHSGSGNYFVFEGDEYKSSFEDPTPKFQYYRPDILIINNVEFDHPDVFSNIEEILDEFRQLIHAMPADGILIYNADDINAEKLAYDSNIAKFSYSMEELSDFTVSDIFYNIDGTSFVVKDEKNNLNNPAESYHTKLPGKINIYNALACIATLRALGFTPEQFKHILAEYGGVKRRFELIGEIAGVTIIDDYAHHPTAVRLTLDAARSRFSSKRIWAVFEPHTFSRTEATLDELSTSFTSADNVLLAEVYPAREHKTPESISGAKVIEAIKKHHKHARLVSSKEEALEILVNEVLPGDVVIIMAVGSFNKLAYDLKDKLSKK